MNFYKNVPLIKYRNYIKKLFPQSVSYILHGDLFIKIPQTKIQRFVSFIHKHTYAQFKVLSDICAVDFPWKTNRFEIFYNFLSVTFNSRIILVLEYNEFEKLYSISNIFNVATWFEREVWDLFGIYFFNNKDLRRILTDYGFKGHPLRKDFPLTGYTEVRYSLNEMRVCVEEVQLTQEFRNFYFKNPWTFSKTIN